jgi:hypothetical protein
MIAKIRNLPLQFAQTHQTKYKNILVSGCSFTWNNSDSHICSWPYYLRDLAGFDQVYDCSQSGGGTNHIFNSIVNEIETNSAVDPESTLIIVMWSGLTRTDVVAHKDIVIKNHTMETYHFDKNFATLSLFNKSKGVDPIDKMFLEYKRFVNPDAQIYESLIKIIALKSYLQNKKFNFLFTSWMNPTVELDRINSPLAQSVMDSISHVPYLYEYAIKNKQIEPNGHPTPDAYLGWTRECLLPCLLDLKICNL